MYKVSSCGRGVAKVRRTVRLTCTLCAWILASSDTSTRNLSEVEPGFDSYIRYMILFKLWRRLCSRVQVSIGNWPSFFGSQSSEMGYTADQGLGFTSVDVDSLIEHTWSKTGRISFKAHNHSTLHSFVHFLSNRHDIPVLYPVSESVQGKVALT